MAEQSLAPRAYARQTSAKTAYHGLRSGPGKAYTLCLTLGRYGAFVALAGEIDVAAAPDITQLMRSLDGFIGPVHVDLRQVTFLDTTGLQPLIEAARRRQNRGLPLLYIDGMSRSVQRLLRIAGLETDPERST